MPGGKVRCDRLVVPPECWLHHRDTEALDLNRSPFWGGGGYAFLFCIQSVNLSTPLGVGSLLLLEAIAMWC